MDLEKFTLAGEKLGYSSEALKDFVENERKIARDEWAQQRAYEKEALEMQLRIETLKKENASKEAKQEPPPGSTPNVAKSPKLPEFKEGHDDMDAYLHRFEIYAKWKHDEWALNISALLHGKGLETYARLSAPEASN